MDTYDGTAVCESCSALDLESKLLEAARHFESGRRADAPVSLRYIHQGDDYFSIDEAGIFICSLGTCMSLPSTCPLCTFLGSMRVRSGAGGRHKLLAICSSSMHFLNGQGLRKKDVWARLGRDFFLAVLPDVEGMLPHEYDGGWLFHEARLIGVIHRILSPEPSRASEPIMRPQVLAEAVDFPRVSRWLSYCAGRHGEGCAAPKRSDTALKELRVLDCATSPACLQIQTFPVRYAALSYVWGHGPCEAWPAVVLDAVEVTRQLGLQYLWVDRLCIDQGNHAEKDYLISKMAWIYGCADFTIVAAAGADAAHGLPGVRSTARTPQPGVRLSRELALVSSMRDPRVAIEESAWSTRGWTYQEGVLSRRRLVFTDEQVYFECRGMALWESVELPLDLYHSECGNAMDSHVRSGVFRGSTNPRSSTLSTVWGFGSALSKPSPAYQETLRIEDHIYAFSQRVLSHDGDSLRAFSGVVDRLASGGPLRTIVGLPVWVGGRRAGTALRVTLGLSLSYWAHTGDVYALRDEEFCVARRRRHLPSWTWAGWAGTVTWVSGGSVHSLVVEALVKALETSEVQGELPYAPAIDLQDVRSGSRVSLSGAGSLDGLANDQPYRLLISEPLILDVNLTAFNPASVTVMMSVDRTKDDVLKAHATGDMRSVLMFYGRLETIMTVARFVVLAEAPPCPDLGQQAWERVGKLDIWYYKDSSQGPVLTTEALQKMPVKRWIDVVAVV